MTDTSQAPSPRAAWEARVVCGLIGLGFAIVVITALLIWGSATNALHTSALSWAWMLLFAVLGGFGLPAAATLLPWTKP